MKLPKERAQIRKSRERHSGTSQHSKVKQTMDNQQKKTEKVRLETKRRPEAAKTTVGREI